MVLIGLGCIIFTLATNKTNYQQIEKSNSKRPALLSKSKHKSNSKAILSLENNMTKEQKHAAEVETALAAAQGTDLATWHTITVQVGDTLSNVFDKLGLSRIALKNLMSSGKTVEELTKIYPGQKLDFLFDDSKDLKAVKLNLSSTKTLHVTNDGKKFKYSYEETTPIKKLNASAGKISGSLYSSAQNAGLDDRLIMQLADIFSYDIDFSLDLRDNDSFKVLYEEEYVEDKKLDPGTILAVEFKNQGKTYKAVRYKDDKGREGYYSPEGYSLQKAFLRSPVEFTRISSHFSSARRHPILHKIRSHKGVDYAAPTGTPVRAAGDGRISFLGNKGGYGKSIEIIHGQKYSTFYAHLSRFNKKIKHGSFVKQGQIIGYVGKTGLATGAHLHYEFRINGVHHNPVTVALPTSQPISNKNKNEFNSHAKNMLSLLDTHVKAVDHE
jgi:murein DD-endopeptidase MepM/ murein hydrolase activator NlpD